MNATRLLRLKRSIKTAIQSAEKLARKQPLKPVPLDKLLGLKD